MSRFGQGLQKLKRGGGDALEYCGCNYGDDSICCSSRGETVSINGEPRGDLPKKYALTISRASQAFLVNPPINVDVDGSAHFSIENGEDVTVTLPTGEHTIEFSQLFRKKKLSVIHPCERGDD